MMRAYMRYLMVSLFMVLLFGGCSSSRVQNSVGSYKSEPVYTTIEISKESEAGTIDTFHVKWFENALFEALYNGKNGKNFLPGKELKLQYSIINDKRLEQNFTDFQTYFGVNARELSIEYVVLDRNGMSIGNFTTEVSVNFPLFPSDKTLMKRALTKSADAAAEYVKVHYMRRTK